MISYKELTSFIWRFMRLQKGLFLFVFTLDLFAWSLDALLWPYILNLVVSIFTRFDGDRLAAWDSLKWVILGGLGLTIYVETASRIMGFLMAKGVPKLLANIRMALFDHIQHHSPHYFNRRFAGSLANKITDMTTQVELIINELFWPILPAISTCILGAGFLWFVNPLFTWLLIAWIGIHLTICLLFARKADHLEHLHGEARSTLLGKIVDSLTNNFAVNLFCRFKYEKRILSPFQRDEKMTSMSAKRYVEKMRIYLSLFYFIVVIVIMFGALTYSWLHSYITTGEVIQVFTTMWWIAMILWNIGASLPILFQSIGVAKQALSVMKDPQDLGDTPQAHLLKVSKGEIRFENVSFHYGENKLFSDKKVHIQGGERVGLVGFTGAGKSTFINLILRFFPLHKGRILIDGQDIAHVTLESLREQIALIPQDPLLFHRTLKENISYGKIEAPVEEIFQAARLAHADEFIRKLSDGYDARVGERGTKLSGGEKQRIAIARAILVNAPILILDEATSSLDSVTEKYIQESLETLMKDRTTIVIAHRLSTLSRMDRILVFDRGKIVEEGFHSSLLEKEGLYSKMWKMQVGGFLPESPSETL
ncbi:MAG: ABC transporter ATP-binding protein [Simkania sp.]|nr:ABC transporter ATP-binding protein [Simkania sp.]MCP5490835.1 ABC transporter ATP-binding protein [Chlamydiales bacterium]